MGNKIKTNLVLGFFAILPIAILLTAFYFIYHLICQLFFPVVIVFHAHGFLIQNILVLISFFAVMSIIFVLGLMMKTSAGRWIWKTIEGATLDKLPGYSAIHETVSQFRTTSNREGAFQQVCFVDPYGSDAQMIGFITAQSSKRYTVFVPSSPNPTSGYVYHVLKHQVTILHERKLDEGLRAIISCGIGTEHLDEEFEEKWQKREI